MTRPALRLHGYWRSGTSYRVRLALALKGVPYEQVTHDLRRQEQRSSDYLAIAPHGLVPALEAGELVLIQSPAILEWIEERWPHPPLLPPTPDRRAIVRAMAATIGCDIHPLNNLRVLKELRLSFSAVDAQVNGWIGRWIGEGFSALEQMIARHGDGFAFGRSPTLADCYLVPQVYSAERFGVDLSPYPRIVGAAARMRDLPKTGDAHPDRQPDANCL